MYIEDKYKNLKNIDPARFAINKASEFSFLVKNLAVNAAKSEIYSRVLNNLESDEVTAGRYFGTPMWDNLILDTEDKKLKIDMVLINVSMSKYIIKTAIQGMSGTTKEYISDGDYSVNIKGAVFSEKNSNAYPKDDVLKLIEICRKPENIRIESGFLGHFDIVDIVIENFKLEAHEATRNIQFFDINAVSDISQELIFKL